MIRRYRPVDDDPITVKCNSEGREPRESSERKLENFVPVVFQRVKEDMRDRKREREREPVSLLRYRIITWALLMLWYLKYLLTK